MYIVYRERYKSFGVDQEGYFVSHGYKMSDKFSHDWTEALRYRNLIDALSDLGIRGLRCFDIENFIKQNEISKVESRNIKIKGVLGEDTNNDELILAILRTKGRIEKVVSSNNTLSVIPCEKEVVEFIKNLISSNSKNSKLSKIWDTNYITKEENDSELWDSFLNS